MPRTSAPTRARLIAAAIAEFADHGLAGARVDQIAAAAAANKRAIYDYFGNKEGLFDAALISVIGDLNEAVPLQPDDLPGYAARLFDYLLAHPAAVRMIAWRRLERPQAGPGLSDTYVEDMLAVRDQAQGTLQARQGDPARPGRQQIRGRAAHPHPTPLLVLNQIGQTGPRVEPCDPRKLVTAARLR